MSSLAGLTTTSSNPTLPTQEEILMHYSEMVAKQLDKQLNPQKGAPAGDEDLSGPSDDEDGPDEPDEPTESSSASDEGSDSMYRSQRTLSNRPPGAPKDSGIDITTLKARKRQANTRRVTAARYTKKNNTQVFNNGTIVSVKIPKKERPTGLDNKRMFARVVARKRNIY
ncbi:hypothetical protein MMC28_011486 [Mycoblastus sanguinarius]|nr:hypothetical protein [Mycoblastus sanguinarius]